jgi:hypothetical protein
MMMSSHVQSDVINLNLHDAKFTSEFTVTL